MTTTPTLTARGQQVLDGIARGRSNAAIGQELNLSQDTVKTHARRLFRTLGANDRAHAVALAYQTGVLAVGPQRPPGPPRVGEHPSGTGQLRITLSVTQQDAGLLGDAMWPNHPNPQAIRTRVFEGLCRVAGATA